jgi:hypothetical protein
LTDCIIKGDKNINKAEKSQLTDVNLKKEDTEINSKSRRNNHPLILRELGLPTVI